MRLWVGFDVGKAFHWACVMDDEGEVLLSRRVEAQERDIERCCEEIAALGGSDERRVATDLLGGPATLLEAVLLERDERLFHLPGMAVNRARDGYRGESKSDARDARVIADQLRSRWRSLWGAPIPPDSSISQLLWKSDVELHPDQGGEIVQPKEKPQMDLDSTKRLRDLEKENARLKKIVADQAVDISILKEVNRKNF